MILLPVFGLCAGFVLGRRWAFVLTLVAGAAGFSAMAALTDEVDGWYDVFVWIDVLVALLATALGLLLRLLWQRRRLPERPLAQP